ncbi:MAG: 5'/3'-nucleotidase SurE [Tissierella sp.]|uniref:5'/3'-nucleotidase SurE n=1 Tax=Tissierella sp. TaxID=41274 RepID=UPI003F98CC2F
MRILLTNDDGIMAEGIQVLAKELEKEHEVIIIAPDSERSAQSQAITISSPLTVKEIHFEGLRCKSYSVSGTPADCVRVGFDKLIKDEVDMVVSGTNRGLNAGMDILYSGTVSAAIEANMYKKPSLAVSAKVKDGKCRFDLAAEYACKVIEKTKDQHKYSNLLLNVNVPFIEKPKGMKVCRIGDQMLDYYEMKTSKEGKVTLEVEGRNKIEYKRGTDRYFLNDGYITITPLHYDLTNFELLDRVDEWMTES